MSAAPRFVHEPAPAGEVWNCTDATPEPVSAEFDVTVTVPLTAAPLAGAVIDPVGGMASTVTEALVPLTAVQEWKTAVTLHSNVPSPGVSEQLSAVVRIVGLVPHAALQVTPALGRRSA